MSFRRSSTSGLWAPVGRGGGFYGGGGSGRGKSRASTGASKPGAVVTVGGGQGSGWLANLPLGLTTQHDINFSSAGDISYSGYYGTSAANYDGSALVPPISANAVARMVLPAGAMPEPDDGFSLGSKALTIPVGTVRVYMTAAVYFSSGYRWFPGNHKFFYFWRHETDAIASVVLGFDTTRPGNSTRTGGIDGESFLNADPQVYTGGQNVFELNQGAGVPAADRSEWHYVEMEVVMNTDSSTANGILRVWLDGVLSISRTDVLWSDNASYMTWRRSNYDPYYGGQNDTHVVDNEAYQYVDHLYVATSTSRS